MHYNAFIGRLKSVFEEYIHTDVAKMNNSVHMDQSQWCLQQYLWQEHLDFKTPPKEKVMKTARPKEYTL